MEDKQYGIEELLDELRTIRERTAEQSEPLIPVSLRDSVIPEGSQTQTASGENPFLLDDVIIKTVDGSGETEVPQQFELESETEQAEQNEKGLTKNIRELRDLRKQYTGVLDPVTEEMVKGINFAESEETGRQEDDVHPIFSKYNTQTVTIPATPAEEGNTGVLPERKKENRDSSGIFNTVEEEDDEQFSKFFGDTVLIEHTGQNKKRRTVEETEDEGSTLISGKEDLTGYLGTREKLGFLKLAVCTIAAFLLLLLNTVLPIAFEYANGSTFVWFNIVLMSVCMLTVIGDLIRGITGLFKGALNGRLLPCFAVVICLVQAVFHLSDVENVPLAAGAGGLTALGCVLSSFLYDSGRSRGYKLISKIPSKYATVKLDDADLSKAMAHDLGVAGDKILIKRKTDIVSDYEANSAEKSGYFKKVFVFEPICIALSIAAGLLYSIMGPGEEHAFIDGAAKAAVVLCPLGMGLSASLPLWLTNKKLFSQSTVIPGYGCASKLDDCNCVLIEGNELFPKDKVQLHGIKTFGDERMDSAVLYAASVLIDNCDTMSNMFLQVIQQKTDMLYDTDSVVYEEGQGFSFWVDQNRVLVGRRELLEAHEIKVPDRDYENRATKTSSRDAIYLAVSGRLCAMFVIGYQPDEQVTKRLKVLEEQGKAILVRTRDFILSADKISAMYGIPRAMVAVVRDGNISDLGEKTKSVKSSPALCVGIGSNGSYVSGVIAACRLVDTALGSANLSMIVSIVLSALTAVLGLTGLLGGLSIWFILAIQLIVLGVQGAFLLTRKTI